ncbi:MAG: hypothetical protein ABSF93_18270 [Candidatus Sulfotelmatobacter sp.]
MPASSEMNLEGRSLDLPVPWPKLPGPSLLKASGAGSFDCVAVRFTDGNSAQDDKAA